jgi:hypothetical protein
MDIDWEAWKYLLGEWESEASSSSAHFRFTYHKIDENTLEARFEIAPPGSQGQFSIYLQGKARKTGFA